jgi:hypothetical protein
VSFFRPVSHRARYLILTNYQLLYLESADVCKGSIDLTSVTGVAVVGSTAFNVTVRGRTYHFFSSEPAQWVDTIGKVLAPIRAMLEQPVPVPAPLSAEDAEAVELVVFVGSMEDLRPNPKERSDNPYFVIGIGVWCLVVSLCGGSDRCLESRQPRGLRRHEFGASAQWTPFQHPMVCKVATSEALSVSDGGHNSPSFADSFVLRLTRLHPLVLDLRVYSSVMAGYLSHFHLCSSLTDAVGNRNDFCYGIVTAQLDDVFMNPEHTVQGWWPVRTGSGDEGRVYMRISLPRVPSWRPGAATFSVPALCALRRFELSEHVPVVFGMGREPVGVVHRSGDESIDLVDSSTKQRLCSLQHSRFVCVMGGVAAFAGCWSHCLLCSFFKREYIVSDQRGLVARCYHKMKSFRKKKLRMILASGELLLSLEGDFGNEVCIKDAVQQQLASVVVCDDSGAQELRTPLGVFCVC